MVMIVGVQVTVRSVCFFSVVICVVASDSAVDCLSVKVLRMCRVACTVTPPGIYDEYVVK